MYEVCSITGFSIATDSTDPLHGVVEIEAAGTTMKFRLDEDIALRICADLDRYLTQTHPPKGKNHQRT
jgi:hypothetical protein